MTDQTGKRIAGAKVTLVVAPVVRQRRSRSGAQESVAPSRRTRPATTAGSSSGTSGRATSYSIVIEARGHNRVETPELTGKAGETHDVGKIVLINTSGYLAGRVVGSDGKPIAGANVFNRGDAPEPVATSTDSQGRFRLEGMFPGRKYAFVRKEGYRFTGIKADDDADGLTITLLKTSEPPPAWKPGSASSYDDQRAFAKQSLDPAVGKVSAPTRKKPARPVHRGHGRDRSEPRLGVVGRSTAIGTTTRCAGSQARELAETDAPGALATAEPETRFGEPVHLAGAGRAVRGDRPQEGHHCSPRKRRCRREG